MILTLVQILIALCTVWFVGLILLFALSEVLNIIRWAVARRGKHVRR